MASFCSRCGKIKYGKQCECKPIESRGTTAERGYGSDWQRLSQLVRDEEPLCVDCLSQGKVEPSTEVHHEIPIRERPELRLERSNLVALCRECHKAREAVSN